MHQLQNKDIGMGYGTLVSLVFHNLPSLYPSSFCRNDFFILVYKTIKIRVVTLYVHNNYVVNNHSLMWVRSCRKWYHNSRNAVPE